MPRGCSGKQRTRRPRMDPLVLRDDVPDQPHPQATPSKFDKQMFSWTIPNFADLKRSDYSGGKPEQMHGPVWKYGPNDEFQWRLVVFPFGYKVDDISIFAQAVNYQDLGQNWKRDCAFGISIQNHHNPQDSFRNEASHIFRYKAYDSGWSQMTMKRPDKVRDPKNGFLCGPKSKDLIINFWIRMKSEEGTGSDPVPVNRFVGIHNQGATCYLNSLLQTLFHLPYLRETVYKMPTDDCKSDDPTIPLALQRLFYRLQTSSDAVDTKELTQAFKWREGEANLQHDIQELSRLLVDSLDRKMKGTELEGTMKSLFCGTYLSCMDCINVDYKTSKKEEFFDISLTVKGCRTLEDSFRQYCEAEIMDGANQYDTGKKEFGKQDIKKYMKFDSFPPVLHIHLKRYELQETYNGLGYVKINDKLIFPSQLKLDEFLKTPHPKHRANYTLQAVLVHAGQTGMSGHYYTFLRPSKDPQWFKFDDDKVTKVNSEAAIDSNYGESGSRLGPSWSSIMGGGSISSSVACAYMLVYVRDALIDQILRPFPSDKIPKKLLQRFQTEEEEKKNAKLYTTFSVFGEKHCKASTSPFDLVSPEIEPYKFKVKLEEPLESIKEVIGKELGIPPYRIRLFKWVIRSNKTRRQYNELTPEVLAKQAYNFRDWVFYMDLINPDLNEEQAEQHKKETEGWCLITCKYYSPETSKISYIGTCMIPREGKPVGSLFTFVQQKKKQKATDKYRAYEEVYEKRIDPTDVDKDLRDNDLQSGDIIIFQRIRSDESEKAKSKYVFPTAQDFFAKYWIATTVRFKHITKPQEEGFLLHMTTETTRAQMREQVQDHLKLKCPLGAIQFTSSLVISGGVVIPWDKSNHSEEMIDTSNKDTKNIVFYQILDVDLAAHHGMDEMRVFWRDFKSPSNNGSRASFYFPNGTTSGVVLASVKKHLVDINKEPPCTNFRLIAVFDHRVSACYTSMTPDVPVIIKERYSWIVEEIPSDQLNARLLEITYYHEKLSHYGRRTLAHCGNPFYIPKVRDEKVSSLRDRIRTATGTKKSVKIAKIDKNHSVQEYKSPDEIIELHTGDYLTIKEEGSKKSTGALKIE